MEKFKFYAPTKVYFGKDEEQRVGKILQEYHPKKVLIHYGGKSAIQSGLLDRVKKALDEANEKGILKSETTILPGISSVSALAAHFGVSWNDAVLASIHGRR